jgi:orotate phosphoribosyltransferase
MRLLLTEFVHSAYDFRPEAPFTLSSGESSPHYIDCRAALAWPHLLSSVSEFIWGGLRHDIDAVGGLTSGADPIAIALSLRSYRMGAFGNDYAPVRWFSVRKEPKGHGAGGQIVGSLELGHLVLIVDDVATTGASAIKAIRAVREFGCSVGGVFVLVDRQASGLEAIQRELDLVTPAPGVVRPKASALFTLDEITSEWQRSQKMHWP